MPSTESFDSGNTTSPYNCSVTEKGVTKDEYWIDDATWILTSSFIIFTMQSGFGLLESGMASKKNEVNIMMKNVVDVIFGGLTYWAIGYGLTFGDDPGSNAFTGFGSFFLNPDEEHMGTVYAKFIFQASFCTTATTIVSGAMAERTKLTAYIAFCILNTLIYSFPAHWVWAPNGWLKVRYVVDVAGVGPVHLVGGVTAFVAAVMVKPRYGRFSGNKEAVAHGNSVNALLGLFILWWGWLGFNCGSTFGISGGKWKLAARSAATTILASCGGGAISFLISFIIYRRKYRVEILVNGVLGALVSITGICAVTTTWAAVLIGVIGACVVTLGTSLLFRLKVDDPVGASAVHCLGSVWGMLSSGFFALKDNVEHRFSFHDGLVWGGGFYLLGVQVLATVVIVVWTLITSVIILKIIDLTIGLRVSLEHELYGADHAEHMIPLSDETMQNVEEMLNQFEKNRRSSLNNEKNFRSKNSKSIEINRDGEIVDNLGSQNVDKHNNELKNGRLHDKTNTEERESLDRFGLVDNEIPTNDKQKTEVERIDDCTSAKDDGMTVTFPLVENEAQTKSKENGELKLKCVADCTTAEDVKGKCKCAVIKLEEQTTNNKQNKETKTECFNYCAIVNDESIDTGHSVELLNVEGIVHADLESKEATVENREEVKGNINPAFIKE